MTRKLIFNVLAIISTFGILCWMITDFYGGMAIYFFSYAPLILTTLICYIISLIETISSVIKNGIRNSKIKLYFHSILLITIVLFNVLQSDLFKSKRILTATLKDDLFYYTLVFRENGTVDNEISGIFGFQETIKGKYKTVGDTIIFSKVPYDNDFIPERLLIDKTQNAIFMIQDKNGNFTKKKEWLNYFEIH